MRGVVQDCSVWTSKDPGTFFFPPISSSGRPVVNLFFGCPDVCTVGRVGERGLVGDIQSPSPPSILPFFQQEHINRTLFLSFFPSLSFPKKNPPNHSVHPCPSLRSHPDSRLFPIPPSFNTTECCRWQHAFPSDRVPVESQDIFRKAGLVLQDQLRQASSRAETWPGHPRDRSVLVPVPKTLQRVDPCRDVFREGHELIFCRLALEAAWPNDLVPVKMYALRGAA